MIYRHNDLSVKRKIAVATGQVANEANSKTLERYCDKVKSMSGLLEVSEGVLGIRKTIQQPDSVLFDRILDTGVVRDLVKIFTS